LSLFHYDGGVWAVYRGKNHGDGLGYDEIIVAALKEAMVMSFSDFGLVLVWGLQNGDQSLAFFSSQNTTSLFQIEYTVTNFILGVALRLHLPSPRKASLFIMAKIKKKKKMKEYVLVLC
jgi:hypothetical protein